MQQLIYVDSKKFPKVGRVRCGEREGMEQESSIVIHDIYVMCLYACTSGNATHANEPLACM